MPTYAYRCTECGHRFEEFQSMTEAPIDRCPVCKGRVERVITGGAGFIFKGSGFYITDYRSDSYKKEAAKENGQKTPPANKDAAKPSPKKEPQETTKSETAKRGSTKTDGAG